MSSSFGCIYLPSNAEFLVCRFFILFFIFIGLWFYLHFLCYRNKDKLIKLEIFLEVKKVIANLQLFVLIVPIISSSIEKAVDESNSKIRPTSSDH